MKFVIFSDSHGNKDCIGKLARFESGADVWIHCGDFGRDIINPFLKNHETYSVRGNCDGSFASEPEELTLDLGGLRIFVTHGHLYGVKQRMDEIVQKTETLRASAAFFGHTHKPLIQLFNTVLLINPGSISNRHSLNASYAVVEVSGGTVTKAEIRYLRDIV